MIKLILALAVIESGMNPKAIGDNGKSVGIMQIQVPVITDVNYFCKKKYKSIDRFDAQKSFEICKLYLEYWGSVYTDRTGKEPSPEVLAKIWNGGAYGWRKEGEVGERLDAYWLKVQEELNRLNK